MKKSHFLAISIFICLSIGYGCKKESTTNNNNNNNNSTNPSAVLTMQVNGVSVTKYNATTNYFHSAGNRFGFNLSTDITDTVEGLSASLMSGVESNTTYRIDASTDGNVSYKNSSTPSFNYYYSAGSNQNPKARLNYRIVKVHNPNEYIILCDVDFDGVLYKRNNPNDSVVITNGRVRFY